MDPGSAVDPAAAAVAALEGRHGTSWVGVDGKGASGKTTLAARIAAALPGSVIVHIDDFARPDVRGWERDRFVQQVVEPLLAVRPGWYQRWDFDRNTGAEWHTVPTGVPPTSAMTRALRGRWRLRQRVKDGACHASPMS